LGLALINHFCRKVFVIGNSMGALLAMIAMAKSTVKISGFVAIAPAFRIKDKRLPFVTYVDAAQRFYQYFAELKEEWPYIKAAPEHPEINYSAIPYHGLFELYKLTREAREYLEKVDMPTLFIQSENETTVDPEATYEAFQKISARDKRLLKLDDRRHVLTIDENLPVFEAILSFLERLK